VTAADEIRFERPQAVLRRRGFSARISRRAVIVFGMLSILAIVLMVASLAIGDFALSIAQVVGALLGGETGMAHTVVIEWRLPRVLAAAIFGLALGASGALFQSLTRNPLGSPDIIGFDAGAYTGVLIATLVVHASGVYSTTFAAIAGGLATAAAVYLFAYRRGVQGFRLIVVGIGVTAMLGSLNTWLLLRASSEEAIDASYWGAGSLANVDYSHVTPAAAIIAVLLIALASLQRGARALEFGDDAARQLGVSVERTRLLLVIVGVALSATVTAFAGPIAFIALSAPQIARSLTRSAGVSPGAAAMTGCVLLLAADVVAQHALPITLPVGIVTVVLGGVYFVWLLIAEGRRS